jgi:ribosome-binding protein aMBF1 (putative translation factor)
MKKAELLTVLQDIREHYHEALAFQIDGKSEAASSKLIDADETLLPLVEAAKDGRLEFKGSATPIEGKTVGERIRFLRDRDGVSQHDILKVLSRPRSHQSWLSRVEDGEKHLSVADLKTLARFFDVHLDQLVP